jgi:hypothetical protein
MRYTIVKLLKFSGNKASVYSVIRHGEQETFLEKFVKENKTLFLSETKDIVGRLFTIGHTTGARHGFFRHFEGTLGDGVCALYDKKKSNLRLYCIRYGTQIIVIGDGGPKKVRTLQEDDKLLETNSFMKWLSCEITERIKNHEIKYINDALDFAGDFDFEKEENE